MNDEARLVRMEVQLKAVLANTDKLVKLIEGESSEPGLRIRVDRLEQILESSRGSVKAIWTTMVTLAITLIGALAGVVWSR